MLAVIVCIISREFLHTRLICAKLDASILVLKIYSMIVFA